jgi:DNA mismatch endonuclease, patch repair protein
VRKDFLSLRARSALMARIKSKNTQPEKALARILRKHHVRFRRCAKRLPGTPDFVLLEPQIAIFVDGGFWHGRNFENLRPRLKPYWIEKIERNMRRDRWASNRLRKLGWSVLRFWDTELMTKPDRCCDRIVRAITQRSEAYKLRSSEH